MDVLALGAHPDDVELCCGGLLALLARQGRAVAIVDLTRGEAATRGTPEERAREAEEAARVLGVQHRENLDLGDGRLESDIARVEVLVRVLRRLEPALVIAPMESDLHPDHAATGRLVKRARYLAGLRRVVPDVPVHRPRHLIQYFQHEIVEPAFIVDVSDVVEQKRRAIRCYRSQLHDPTRNEPETMISSARFLEQVEARDRHFGSLIGSLHGEPYTQPHPPRVTDAMSLLPP